MLQKSVNAEGRPGPSRELTPLEPSVLLAGELG